MQEYLLEKAENVKKKYGLKTNPTVDSRVKQETTGSTNEKILQTAGAHPSTGITHNYVCTNMSGVSGML